MKLKFKKIRFNPQYLFYIVFFVLYAVVQYYFLYHVNGLQPFQVSFHFTSNVIGSFSKRFLSEAAPYALIFYLLYYTKRMWVRVFLITLFEILFLINILTIGFYFVIRSNFQLYILEGFNWHLFFSYFNLKMIAILVVMLAIMAFMAYIMLLIRNKKRDIWVFKIRLFSVFLLILAVLAPALPIGYTDHVTVMVGDQLRKKFFRTINLEHSGLSLFAKEIKYNLYSPTYSYQTLTDEEEKLIEEKNLEIQVTSEFSNPARKIIVILVESFNQEFISYYNPHIEGATPFIDSLFQKYPHIDEFYPSAPFTLDGMSSTLCGHTNSRLIQKNGDYTCLPKLLAKKGYESTIVLGLTKYYVGGNLHYQKFGFDKQVSKEDFEQKYPEFKKEHRNYFNTWGYTDNYIFDETIDILKQSQPEDKVFLTLHNLDTHASGGRCTYEKTEEDPEEPMLFSIKCFDRVFKEFMSKLEDNDLLTKDTVILLTADHLYPAFSMIPGSSYETSFILKPGKIPFLMISGSEYDLKSTQGSHIDIASTVLDLVNVDIPSYYMGKSLISSEHAVPMGQDRENGYIIIGNSFYPLSLDPNIRQYLEKEIPKGFVISIHDTDDIATIAQQKIDEMTRERNQESALYKWYYNKYYNLYQ